MILTPPDLRAVVIDCLRKAQHLSSTSEQYQVGHLWREVAEVARARGFLFNSTLKAWNDHPQGYAELHPNLRQPAWDIVWDLIVEGIPRPGAGTGGLYELPYIHVTEYGTRILENPLTPYDPERYLRRLSEKIPTIDPVIVKYMGESAETLRRNCLLSSTITLGCASEKAFLLLLEAYKEALDSDDRVRFDGALGNARGIKQQHQEFMKDYANLKPRLKASVKDNDWMTGLENALVNVFSYFRDMRNDAGHPTGVEFNRDLALSHLVVFPYYLRIFYDLIEWLDKHKPL